MKPLFALFLLQGSVTYSDSSWLTPGLREWLIVMGALLFVSLIAAIWLAITVNRRRHHHRHHSHHHSHHHSSDHSASPESNDEESGSGEQGKHRHSRHKRRRRRHREERPRNPTLAETGGLPPVREAQNPGSSPSPSQPR